MVATSRFAAIAPFVLSTVSAAAFPSYPACKPTTTTFYTTVTVPAGQHVSTVAAATPTKKSSLSQEYTPPSDFTYSGVTFPTYSPENPNPNGPYYNPNDYIPEPITWPGLPKPGQTTVPDVPSGRPRPLGGFNADAYNGPAWCLRGSDLKPALPQKDTNGNSNWGLIDCPRLPPYSGNGAVPTSSSASHGSASKTSSTAHSSKTSTSNSNSHGSATLSSFTSGSSLSSALPSSGFSFSANSTKSLSSTISSSASTASPSAFPPRCENNTRLACGKMPDTGVVNHYDFDIAYDVAAPDGVKRNVILVNGQFPGPLIEANWGDWIEVTVTNSLPLDASDQGEPTAIHWHGFLQHETPFYDGVPSVMQGPIAPGKSVTYKFRADHYGTSWV
jgi:hypothetical protein